MTLEVSIVQFFSFIAVLSLVSSSLDSLISSMGFMLQALHLPSVFEL